MASEITVTVSKAGIQMPFILSQKVLLNCQKLRAVPNGATITGTTPRAFEVLVNYLEEGDDRFELIFELASNRDHPLTIMVETWILAQQLDLRAVGNQLIERFRDYYRELGLRLRRGDRPGVPIPIQVDAFDYVRTMYGRNPQPLPKIECFLLAYHAGLLGERVNDARGINDLRFNTRARLEYTAARFEAQDIDDILLNLELFKIVPQRGEVSCPPPELEVIMPDAASTATRHHGQSQVPLERDRRPYSRSSQRRASNTGGSARAEALSANTFDAQYFYSSINGMMNGMGFDDPPPPRTPRAPFATGFGSSPYSRNPYAASETGSDTQYPIGRSPPISPRLRFADTARQYNGPTTVPLGDLDRQRRGDRRNDRAPGTSHSEYERSRHFQEEYEHLGFRGRRRPSGASRGFRGPYS